MTQPKKKPTPPALAPAPTEKRFRVTIITRKEVIKAENTGAPDVTLMGVLEEMVERITSQDGYATTSKDGLGRKTDKALRWIPLHMIEQVEVTEITEDGQ